MVIADRCVDLGRWLPASKQRGRGFGESAQVRDRAKDLVFGRWRVRNRACAMRLVPTVLGRQAAVSLGSEGAGALDDLPGAVVFVEDESGEPLLGHADRLSILAL